MRIPKNLIRHELIGLQVRIATSTNKKQEGLEGTVINESRNTLCIETMEGEKILIKDQCVFSFKLGPGWVNVEGKLLVARPEDRIKKKQKNW